MAKSSSRQNVSSHSYKLLVLDTDGFTYKHRSASVILNTEGGMFDMTLPEEVYRLTNTRNVFDFTLGGVVSKFTTQIEKYEAQLRASDRKRIILVYYAYNYGGKQSFNERHVGIGGTFSSDKVPVDAIGLEYDLMWQIGDSLYDIHFNDDGTPAGNPVHRHRLPVSKGYHIIEWTQEREDFLERMVDGMRRTINQMKDFFRTDPTLMIDNAIASNVQLALTQVQT